MSEQRVAKNENNCILEDNLGDILTLTVHDGLLFVKDHDNNEYYMTKPDVKAFIQTLKTIHYDEVEYNYIAETDRMLFKIEREGEYVGAYKSDIYLSIQPKFIDYTVSELILKTNCVHIVQHQLLQVRMWLENIVTYLKNNAEEATNQVKSEYETIRKYNGETCVAFTLREGNYLLGCSIVEEGYQLVLDGQHVTLSEEAYENLKDLLQEIKK